MATHVKISAQRSQQCKMVLYMSLGAIVTWGWNLTGCHHGPNSKLML